MKKVSQLDTNGFFAGITYADESPLEPGIYLIPALAIDVDPPTTPEGYRARWDNRWVYEPVSPPPTAPEEPVPVELTYAEKRANEYPDFREYLDGIVKSDQAQIAKYIADCLAVKAKYPKPEA
jgi:hypothetical protein